MEKKKALLQTFSSFPTIFQKAFSFWVTKTCDRKINSWKIKALDE